MLAHARNPKRLAHMGFDTVAADLTHPDAATPVFWKSIAADVTHIVNVAGLLTAPDAAFQAVHVDAPKAVYAAFPDASGVLISAVGIDDAPTPFARYRRLGEEIAHMAGLTVLRPGLVLGDTSYGGSSLARALSVLPIVTPVVGNGSQAFNPIHASDLSTAISALLKTPQPNDVLHIGGPETVTQSEMLQGLRRWFGLRPAKLLRLPRGLALALGRVGDAMRLGPISRTAVTQLETGVLSPSSPGLPPARGFSEFLFARPAGTQDLWHARLYLMRPVLRIVMAILWFLSGLIGLFLPSAEFLPLVPNSPLPDWALVGMARLGAVVDLLLAAALLRGWRPRLTSVIQFAMVGLYTVAFSLLAPVLWVLPLGGLLKNLPILVLIAVLAILEEER